MAVVTIVFVFMVRAMAVVLARPKAGRLAAAPLAIMIAVAELASGMARNRPGDVRRAQNHAALREKCPQFLQGAAHAFACRYIIQFQRRRDVLRRPVFKVAQNDGVAVDFAQPAHAIIQQW